MGKSSSGLLCDQQLQENIVSEQHHQGFNIVPPRSSVLLHHLDHPRPHLLGSLRHRGQQSFEDNNRKVLYVPNHFQCHLFSGHLLLHQVSCYLVRFNKQNRLLQWSSRDDNFLPFGSKEERKLHLAQATFVLCKHP